MLASHARKPRQPKARQSEAKVPLSISLSPLLIDGSDAEFRRLIYRMLIAQARLDEVRRRIAQQVGVSSAQYPMVMAILRLEGDDGVSISRLADYLEVTGPHVTGEVRKLVAVGIVRKAVNPADLRSVQVKLSSFGRKRLMASFDYIRQVNDILFCGVSAEEFRALAKFNKKFMSNTTDALAWTDKPSARDRGDAASTGEF
jgi:DNA-binding MarR family transcriptional regulator